jgi:hypothetical protein
MNMTNPMAQAWLEASEDLGIRVVHPFRFKTLSGEEVETVGVYLPDFGSPAGMLLTCRFDSDKVCELADETEFRTSGLNPESYEPYQRERYIQTLSDWGWYGLTVEMPSWYDPDWRNELTADDA